MATTCTTCGKKIRIPSGWSVGAAVRRHYWSKHREVMTRRRPEASTQKRAVRKAK